MRDGRRIPCRRRVPPHDAGGAGGIRWLSRRGGSRERGPSALRLFRRWDSPKNYTLDERGLNVQRRAFDPERWADTMRPCACLFCTQKRREHSGPTLRERRFDDVHRSVPHD